MSKTSDCPLLLHRNGQWYKKIKGKFHYFGRDKDKALNDWAEDKDDLLAGRPRRSRTTPDSTPTVVELGNLFIDRCRKRAIDGDIEARSIADYEKTIRRFIEFVGSDCRPGSLEPRDFARIKDKFAAPVERKTKIRGGMKGPSVERRSPTTVAGDIRRTRAFLSWAYKAELIPVAPRYGDEFSPSQKKAIRRQRAKAGRRDIQPEDLRAIIGKCSTNFLPIVLLGINAGLGNLDVAEMRFSDVRDLDADEVWVDLPRNKTGADRRFLLWPETCKAIRVHIEKRVRVAGRSNEDRLLLTRHGHPWLRSIKSDRKDAIASAFQRVRKAASVDRGTYYDLRRTFQTVAAQTRDFPAVSHVMGHVPSSNDMAAVYTQHINDDRLRAVCNHVRTWLFGTASEDGARNS